MKILVINGPNINMLGIREKNIYGQESYASLCRRIKEECGDIECEIFQSNHEGAIVDKIQSALGDADWIIINPAAYTHTSIAIYDALMAVNIPAIEVHISDTDKREEFRKISYISPACKKVIKGKGTDGYIEAVDYIKKNR